MYKNALDAKEKELASQLQQQKVRYDKLLAEKE